MTKSELIEQVAETSGIAKGRAELAVNAIFSAMSNAMIHGEGIEIRGFGSFTVRQYKSYEGRNPRTGEVVHVAPKRLPFFKVGKDLRIRINRGPKNGISKSTGQANRLAPEAAMPDDASPSSANAIRSERVKSSEKVSGIRRLPLDHKTTEDII